jgi:S1-C subfamily serine protease
LVLFSVVSAGFDFYRSGPITGMLLRIMSPNIERTWGFTAENHMINGDRWLVVTSVVPGGPFDRAGIKPDNAVLRYGCIAWDSAVYRQLFEAREVTTLRVIRDPARWADTREEAAWVKVTRDQRPGSAQESTGVDAPAIQR